MNYKNIQITWLGHSGFMIKTQEGIVIYIDPFRIPPNIGGSDEEKADFIFLTHSHYDHCSIDDIRMITKNGTKIICTPDCQSKFRHITDNLKIHVAEPDSRAEFVEGKIRYWCVRAYNLNKNYHPREEDFVGYIIQIGDDPVKVLIYHAGDSDLIPEMKHLKEIDLALLPIGGNFTMNAGEAAKAASVIQPKMAIPMHYGSLVGSKEDADIFMKLCSQAGVDAKVLEIAK
jgi:L-ascorbate metabolism protein UlaG (beta-lactamase superfamily)